MNLKEEDLVSAVALVVDAGEEGNASSEERAPQQAERNGSEAGADGAAPAPERRRRKRSS